MKDFQEAKKEMPTRFELIRAIDDTIKEMIKTHKGITNKGRVFFTSVNTTARCDKLATIKSLLTRMTNQQYTDLQKVEWAFRKDNQATQSKLFHR